MRHQRGQLAEVAVDRADRGLHHGGVRRPRVVGDEEAVLAADDRVLDVVLDALLARADAPELALRVRGVQAPDLGGDLGPRRYLQVLLAARLAHPDPVGLVGLVEHRLVVVTGGPQAVPPHGVRPPRVVDRHVEDEASVAGPRHPGGDAGDLLVRRGVAGVQGPEAQRVALVALGVGGPGQSAAVVAHRERAERKVLVALGLGVAVQQQLLPGQLDPGRDLRRHPAGRGVGVRDVLGRHRDPAVPRVGLPLGGAGEVPPAAGPDRDRHVGLLDPRPDLLVHLVLERLQLGRHGVRVGVLRLEVRAGRRGVLVAQPLVVVHQHAAVVLAAVGAALGRRGGGGRCDRVAHADPPPIQSANDSPEIRS